ncbi:MAG: ATP-grasp domain-containing protein [Bacteroidota bacterium]
MAKKLRVAILYNQPVAGTEEERKYVAENGQLQTVSARNAKTDAGAGNGTAGHGQLPSVDLSEIGVIEEMEDIKTALSALGYRPSILNVDSNIFRLIDYLKSERPDLIFNLVECVENEALQEMNVAGIYELLNIPYTGAPALALGIALHKPRVKEILTYHGIKTPKFQVFHLTDKIIAREDMGYPMIVKPSHEDASVGISDKSVVYNIGELRKRVRFIHQEFEQPALVEEYIEGREFNVAIIGNKKPIAMPISEIDFSGLTADMHKIVSYDAKWMHGTVAFDGTRGVCPADIPAAVDARLREIALRCYQIIGCRDYARVDFRLAKDGTPYVLEVNPNPDISDDAGFARSAKAYGLNFPQIVGKIVEYAAERCQ